MKISLDGRSAWVNFNHLFYFYSIVSAGGLSGASRELGIGQSALSIQLGQLEKTLGVRLMDRSRRKLALNEHGRIVYGYAKEVFRVGAEMVEALRDRPPGKTHLAVGALDTIPKHLMADLAEAALRISPCSLSVLEGKQSDLLRDLIEHRLDLVVTNVMPRVASGAVHVKRIARLPLWIVGCARFRRLKREFPRCLAGQPFVLPTAESSVRQEFDHFARRHELHPDVVAEAQDVVVQKLLAARGVGLTIAPEFAVREYLQDRRLSLIGPLPAVAEDLYLVSAPRRLENPVAAALVKGFKVG